MILNTPEFENHMQRYLSLATRFILTSSPFTAQSQLVSHFLCGLGNMDDSGGSSKKKIGLEH